MNSHHHHILWHLYPKKELTKVYLSLALRYFALSLIALFVPLYLHIEIGYSLNQTLMFFIFYSLVFGIFTPFAAKFASRYGVKHSVLFSIPFYLAFVILLHLLSTYKISLMVLGFLVGVSLAFYWMGMNLIFYHASDHAHRGEESGKKLSVSLAASLLGPFVGGALIMYFGFPIVFLLSTILLFSSAIVLFLSKEEHIHYHFSIKSVVNKKHWQNSLFFVSEGALIISSGVIWPLYIFSILGSYFSLGLVGSILAGVSAVIILIIGKLSDRVNKRKIIKWISGFEALSWVIKSMVNTVLAVYGASIFGAITHGVRVSPTHALELDKAKGNPAGYFVSRELFLCLGRVLVLVIVIMGDSLSGGLVFRGVISLAALIF